MVKAILAGRKTQTRRVIRDDWWRCLSPNDEDDRAKALKQCPYGQPGDELWVRETWALDEVFDQRKGSEANELFTRWYRADESKAGPSNCNDRCGRWRSSRFMPRWASRLQLVIRDRRLQRLQEISEEDAIAEGARHRFAGRNQYGQEREGWSFEDPHPIDANQQHGYGRCLGSARFAFGNGWNCLNAKRAPWLSNPFVWAITFERKV